MLKNAFRFIWYDKAKMFGVLAGIIVCVFLIGQQLSIFFAIMRGVRGISKTNTEYIWVTNKKTLNVQEVYQMDTRSGQELQSVEGITSANPIVIASGAAKFKTGKKVNVILVGVQSPQFVGLYPTLMPNTNKQLLINDGAVFLDFLELKSYDTPTLNDYFEINDNRVYFAGQTNGAAGTTEKYVYTTIERARYLGNVPRNSVTMYLLTWDSTRYAKQQMINKINAQIPNVMAWDAENLGFVTITNFLKTSPIGISFALIVVFAIISGLTIVGLTMFSSVKDRIRDYGTIKAIGGSNALITRMILEQAIVFAFIGYGIALVMLLGLTSFLMKTKIQAYLPKELAIALFFTTIFISIMGSLVAIRKITKLEPVEIFRM